MEFPYLDHMIDVEGKTVSVVLPALNEQATVGHVVEQVRTYPKFHEVIVIDADSTDATAQVAQWAGAQVHRQSEIRPDEPIRGGKGDTMWRGLNVATGDIIVFMDSDLRGDISDWAPLLAQQALWSKAGLTKGYYRRAYGDDPYGGGRVTEIMARPLLNALWPRSAEVRQPLGGEYALSREFARSVSFPATFAVEVSLLIDAIEGRRGVAQVDLGVKEHESQSTLDLGTMSFQILAEIHRRTGVTAKGRTLTQYAAGGVREYTLTDKPRLPAIDALDLTSRKTMC